MRKLVFVNVLMRETSRTKIITNYALEKLKNNYEITEIDLRNSKLLPLNSDTYLEREKFGERNEEILEMANNFKDADKILIAAPFWDMSFPAILKVFFERISLYNITFTTDETGALKGKCKADKLLYINSKGSDILDKSPLDTGYNYISAIAHLYGIDEIIEVSMTKIDVPTTDVNLEIEKAKRKLDEVLKDF